MRKNVRWNYLARAPRLLWDIACRGRYDFRFDMMPLHLRNMSLTKRCNLLASGLNLVYRRLRPWSWPLHMQVELTNFCNCRCPVCPTGAGTLGRDPGTMDVDVYHRLMDEAGPYLLTVLLWGWGEPLLHPQFAEFIRLTRAHDVVPIISTNGQNLHERHVQDDLLAHPPTYLIVAIDGLTDQTNSRYRVGAKLAGVLEGVARLAREKAQHGRKLPILHMRYMVMKHNQHERPDVERFAASHGFDQLAIRTLSIIDDETIPIADLVPDDRKYQAYDLQADRPGRRNDFICQHAFCFPGIQLDGTVVPCDQDFRGRHAIGRFGDGTSFADIWFGRAARSARRTIRRDRRQFSFCRNCPYADRKTNTCSVELARFTDADLAD